MRRGCLLGSRWCVDWLHGFIGVWDMSGRVNDVRMFRAVKCIRLVAGYVRLEKAKHLTALHTMLQEMQCCTIKGGHAWSNRSSIGILL
jgi:hypothetical protein